MRKLLLLPLLIVLAVAAKSQNRGTIRATVIDSVSRQPVQLATVSLLKLSDTSLVSYTVTDKNGTFVLHNIKQEPSRLLISHVGYRGLHLKIDFKNGELINLGDLYLSSRMLQEVVVKGERVPVIMRKDTLEFDALAFKTRPNAMVRDLLMKLPGVQINRDGITVNGKAVSKIKVNGRIFFVNDPSIATDNLPAELISKVQVYDDRDDDPDHITPSYQVKKIINLKFKNKFLKGVLSSLGAGGGTQDRYVASGFAAKFSNDVQISGKLDADNLSGTQLFFGNNGGFAPVSYSNNGIKKGVTGNFDIDKDLSKKLHLHSEYRFDNTRIDNGTQTKTQQNIRDTIFTALNSNTSYHKQHNQKLYSQLEWKPDSLTEMKWVPNIEYNYNGSKSTGLGRNSNNFVPLLNTTLAGDEGHISEFTYDHNFNYHRKLNKKGLSLNIGNSISVHPQHSIDFNANDLMSYVIGFPSDTLRRSIKNVNNDVSEVVSAGLHDPFTKKASFDIGIIALHDRNKGELLTYDEDFKTGLYTIFVQSQSNTLTRNLWGESLNPQFTVNFTDDISIKAGVNMLTQQIGNDFGVGLPQLNQNFFYLFPTGEIHIRAFTFGYNKAVQQPSISSLQPITVIYDPLHKFIGNPNLKPVKIDNFSLSFQHNKYQAGFNLNAGAEFSIAQNTIINQQIVNAVGGTVTTPVNGEGSKKLALHSSFYKSFKKQGKWDFGIDGTGSVIYGNNYFLVNGQPGFQNTTQLLMRAGMYADWNKMVSIRPYYDVDYAVTNYKDVNYPHTSYTTHTATLQLNVTEVKHFSWKTEYTFRYVPLAPAGFQRTANLLNMTLSRRIQKDKAEIGITCYDLLNQNVSQVHYVSLNTITDVQNQILKRYLMFTYTYHFSRFK
ncbi:MAG: outer membrane beta-barrel protein [Mucilaginibacter sp.]